MIEGILSTDMVNHQKVVSGIKAKIQSLDIIKGKNFEKICEIVDETNNLAKLFEAQQSVLNMLLHSSDISNPAKPEKISGKWTKMVYEEFFLQGDMEKESGLPISMFCDRVTTNINKAMIGFINFVILPTFEIIVTLIPEVGIYKEYCKVNLRKHQLGWKNDEKLLKELEKKKLK